MKNVSTSLLLLLALAFTACQPQAPEQDPSPETSTEPAAAPTDKHPTATPAPTVTPESAPTPVPAPAPVPAEESPVKVLSNAEKVLNRTVEAHGGARYNSANYSFVFRDKAYTFQNDGSNFRYSVSSKKDSSTIVDVLNNGQLTRTVDGTVVELSAKDVSKYSEALNSVVYFATLPHKLLDPAVRLTLREPASLKGKAYYTLMVQFNEEGGGTDHDDNFRYWINQRTDRIDYLAYDYKTNGGGVRFRRAYNPRVVDGVLFQDYVNYKAPTGTNLDDLPSLFDRGELEELSRIETEDVEIRN